MCVYVCVCVCVCVRVYVYVCVYVCVCVSFVSFVIFAVVDVLQQRVNLLQVHRLCVIYA